ncbi:MAG: type II secretion system protein [Halothece sp. Uz-M2-17]|nr:type II secretion system protein [Halothece sp. Uz-M2-17]
MIQKTTSSQPPAAGFTLIELLVITVIVGVLATLSTSGIFGFVRTQRLKSANNQVSVAIREAQNNAISDKVSWQASFREQGNQVEWAVHPDSVSASNANWYALEPTVSIDNETDLPQSNGVYRVVFDQRGTVETDLGGITLTLEGGSKQKRCVLVSTILGTIHTSRNQATPKNGKDCY